MKTHFHWVCMHCKTEVHETELRNHHCIARPAGAAPMWQKREVEDTPADPGPEGEGS